MSYGKYGMKMRVPRASGYGSDYDTGYAIGAALGNLWGANYNKRGIEKGMEDADAWLANYGNNLPESQPASDELYQQAVNSGIVPQATDRKGDAVRNVLGNNGIVMSSAGNIDLTQRPQVRNSDGSVSTVRSMSFNEDGKEVLIPTISPGGKVLSDTDAIAQYRKSGQHLGKYGSVDEANQAAKNIHDSEQRRIERNPQVEKQDFKYQLFSKYLNSPTPNPVGDKIAVDNSTSTASRYLQDVDFSKMPTMSVEDMQAALTKELRAAGRTDYQIEQILERMNPQLKSKVQQVNQQKFSGLANTMQDQIAAGDLTGANLTLVEMSRIDPNAAKVMAGPLSQAMKRAEQRNAINDKIGLYQEYGASPEQARNLAVWGKANAPWEQVKSADYLKAPAYLAAIETQKYLDAKAESGVPLTEDEQRRHFEADNIIKAHLGAGMGYVGQPKQETSQPKKEISQKRGK